MTKTNLQLTYNFYNSFAAIASARLCIKILE